MYPLNGPSLGLDHARHNGIVGAPRQAGVVPLGKGQPGRAVGQRAQHQADSGQNVAAKETALGIERVDQVEGVLDHVAVHLLGRLQALVDDSVVALDLALEEGVGDGPAELLYFGRLEYEKGVHDVIAALPRIRRTHPGTTLTIAGDGTQYDWLVEEARKAKVTKAVNFVGRVDHSGLLELLHRADAAVLPSHYEPFGIVALEAAAAGTPLVTSNVGGLGEAVINGKTGVSCPPRNVGALASAVRKVLDDPAGAQQRALAARDRLNHDFSWQTVAAETADVYLAAKRGERLPHARRPIVERPLPDRG